jgi:hypothetical protein
VGGDRSDLLARGDADPRTQQWRNSGTDRSLELLEAVLVDPGEASEIDEEPLVCSLDGRADALKSAEERAHDRVDEDRIGLTDDRVGGERRDFMQRQTGTDAIVLGFWRAVQHDFALARTPAEHDRTAVPLGMTERLDADQELVQPDAGDTARRPGERQSGSRITA